MGPSHCIGTVTAKDEESDSKNTSIDWTVKQPELKSFEALDQ